MTDREKAREWCNKNVYGKELWPQFINAYLAGSASRDAEVEALKAKVDEILFLIDTHHWHVDDPNSVSMHLARIQLGKDARAILDRPTSPDSNLEPKGRSTTGGSL